MTHDPACVALPEPEPEPEVIEEEVVVDTPPPKVDQSDSGTDAGTIVGIVLALVVLSAIGLVGFLIWRKRRNNRNMGQIEGVKLGNSKEMKSSINKQTRIVKQDLGGDEDVEEQPASDNRANVGQSGREQLITEDGCGHDKDQGPVSSDK